MPAIARLGFVVLLLGSSACAHFRVVPDAMSPSTPERGQRVHAIAWGALESRVAPSNCNGNGLAGVTFKVTLADALATVATLGFWTPVRVEWTCAKERGEVSR